MGLIHSRLFQSTLPRRERRKRWFRNADFLHFNPRSREGSDQYNSVRSGAERFQSTLPRRERLGSAVPAVTVDVFQSTLPRRERPHHIRPASTAGISIHAPAKGATIGRVEKEVRKANFNPRSREGSDKSVPLARFSP